MLFVAEYRVLNAEDAAKLYLENAFHIPDGLKILHRFHVVGEPRGILVFEGTPAAVHELVVMLPPDVLDLNITLCIDDEENRAILRRKVAHR